MTEIGATHQPEGWRFQIDGRDVDEAAVQRALPEARKISVWLRDDPRGYVRLLSGFRWIDEDTPLSPSTDSEDRAWLIATNENRRSTSAAVLLDAISRPERDFRLVYIRHPSGNHLLDSYDAIGWLDV